MYLHILIPRTKFGWSIYLFIFAVLFGILSYRSTTGFDSVAKEPIEMSNTSYLNMEEGQVYKAEQVNFVEYIKEEDGLEHSVYMLVDFYDKEGRFCVAPMKLQKTDAIYDRVVEDMNDESQEIGSLSVPVYFIFTSENKGGVISGFEVKADSYELYLENVTGADEAENTETDSEKLTLGWKNDEISTKIRNVLDYVGDGELPTEQFVAENMRNVYLKFGFNLLLAVTCAVVGIVFLVQYGGFHKIREKVSSVFESDMDMGEMQ